MTTSEAVYLDHSHQCVYRHSSILVQHSVSITTFLNTGRHRSVLYLCMRVLMHVRMYITEESFKGGDNYTPICRGRIKFCSCSTHTPEGTVLL